MAIASGSIFAANSSYHRSVNTHCRSLYHHKTIVATDSLVEHAEITNSQVHYKTYDMN